MALSAVTDLFDGQLARRWGVISRFGALADPLMDKVFYVATLPAAVFLAMRGADWTHAGVLLGLDVISMLRDQWVSFLRSVGSGYGADVRANWSGKLRTAMGFPVIVLMYLYLGLQALGVSLAPAVRAALFVLEAALVAITLMSALTYTREYLPHLRRAMDE
jgi:phosphatidylglycerophosphate synthase